MKNKLMFVLAALAIAVAGCKDEEPKKEQLDKKATEEQWIENHKGYEAKPGKSLFP